PEQSPAAGKSLLWRSFRTFEPPLANHSPDPVIPRARLQTGRQKPRVDLLETLIFQRPVRSCHALKRTIVGKPDITAFGRHQAADPPGQGMHGNRPAYGLLDQRIGRGTSQVAHVTTLQPSAIRAKPQPPLTTTSG